jgi:hypothetical protein
VLGFKTPNPRVGAVHFPRAVQTLMRQIGELKVENDFLRKKYEAYLDGKL